MQLSSPKTKAPSSSLVNFNNFKIGLIISLVVQPFEVIRTSSIMSMRNNSKGVNLSGTFQTIKQIFHLEGPRGFFRGGLLGVGKSTLGAGIFFTGLENVHGLTQDLRKIKYIHSGFIDFLDAGLSKIVTTFLVNPITVLKTRFEVVGINEYKSIKDAIKSIYMNEGAKGFYKGILATMIRDVPYSGIQYSSYKWCYDMYSRFIDDSVNPQSKPGVVLVISIISAAWAVMLTYPFDNLRVRIQCFDFVNHENNKVQLNMLNNVKNIWKEEGNKGFYIGYIPRLMKKATSSALTWSLYEKFKKEKKAQV